MIRIEIVENPIGVDRGLGLPGGSDGAVVEFQGVVRGEENGTPISGIEYECHRPMAEAQLRKIAEAVARERGLSSLDVVHRVGLVPAGETSLFVRAVSPHRGEAFAAVADLIDRLKRDVPIWKHAK